MEGNKAQVLPRIVKVRCSNCGYTWTLNIPKDTPVRSLRCPRCGWLFMPNLAKQTGEAKRQTSGNRGKQYWLDTVVN